MRTILILNDGETFTDLDDCEILVLTDSGSRKLTEGVKPRHLLGEDIQTSFTIKEV